MKIHLVNYNPSSFQNNISKIEHLLVRHFQKIEMYSEIYGYQLIKHNKVYQIESNFDTKIIFNKYKEFDLLLEYTKYNEIEIISQLPVKYILKKSVNFEYKSNKRSKLSLIVQCVNQNETIIPIDLYFEYNDTSIDLSDLFFQEDFNVLLSCLN